MEELRILIYPLGFLPGIFFGARALLQWLSSESQGRSIVTPTFWRLSLAGNTLLMVHALFQSQFHVCIVQACNAMISWRNLDLMRPQGPAVSRRTAITLIIAAITVTANLFIMQGLLQGSLEWFRIPATPWGEAPTLPYAWHLLGMVGIPLFASRFWVQWWYAELHQKSLLGPQFWWISLIGDMLCLVYFSLIKDPVNLIGPALGMIPYIRNLMLIRKEGRAA